LVAIGGVITANYEAFAGLLAGENTRQGLLID